MRWLICFSVLFTHYDLYQGTTVQNPNTVVPVKISNVTVAREWLQEYNNESQAVYYRTEIASWNYESNITDYNEKLSVSATLQQDKFRFLNAANASEFDWEHFADNDLKRQFRKITNIGTSAMQNETKLERLSALVADMQSIYSTGRVCLDGMECMHIEPGLTELFVKNRSYETLLNAWKSWRDETGKKIRPLFTEFVQLSNEAIRQAGYNDTGEYWRSAYEDKNFQSDVEALFQQVKPLYESLHIYVRRKLQQIYGKENFPASGHIPAHLLGNMWAQTWNNVLDMLLPYPNKPSVDVTPQMVDQKYTPLKMFKTAEKFYTGLGLKPMPPSFWNNSIIENPEDGRQLTCHASAWDFYNSKDFRIKMCTRVNMEDLITIHHEMGHIQYFLQYKDLPLVYRDGANPGFHEAVGDTLALSVGTPKHLQLIKLLQNTQPNNEATLNFLMKVALEKIAFLPFGYLIDMYRWDVFSGKTPVSEYNKHWWDLRCKYQGLSPPVWRSEEDFDPGAKFHVAANVPYIRYFVSFVVQFQFHKALCDKAGQTGNLYECDINESKAAGKLLSGMLKLGSSKPWSQAMQVLTGQQKMNASALLDFFAPLQQWLKTENAKANDTKGWLEACPGLTEEDKAQQWLHDVYEPLAEDKVYKAVMADWNYNTDLTDSNQAKTVETSLELSEFSKEAAVNASQFHWKTLKNSETKRQFDGITSLGTNALTDTNKLKRLTELTSKMESLYGKGSVCLDSNQCLELDPGLTRLMASNRDYNQLKRAWEGWRDVTGKQMKEMYGEFVNISNEAIRHAGFNDTGEEWRSAYETDHFQQEIADLLEQIQPLYQQLHAFVRGKLRNFYGKDWFPTSGHIPAHLLGNMWAHQWNNIYDIVEPYKNQPTIDVTPELKKQKFTPVQMFRNAEEFYTSIGLLPMPASFWTDSMITKPTDGRKVVCHPSAWDFRNRKDYRIKMCTDVNMQNLITILHEMGHIQYFLQYKDLPIAFRTGANPGFHEAVGDTLALSASTRAHLHKIGLLKAVNTSYESDINFLLKIALEKIAFLPFGYLIDQWRWSVFSGDTTPNDYNQQWWQLRCKYQGISSPVTRHDTDFDPGAEYHVAANTPYIRYFVSFIIQFQFHKALCDAAEYKGVFHECDIYQSKEAGQKLGDMLRMGASRPWPEAMYRITGQRKMNAGPLMEYFRPLIDWLKKENSQENIGWSETCPSVPIPVVVPQTKCPTPPPHVGSAHKTSSFGLKYFMLFIVMSLFMH